MVETAESIADMSMVAYIELCSEKNVTELDAIIRVLNMMKEDITLALIGFTREMKKKLETKEEITTAELDEYTNRVTSIGGLIMIMNEKMDVAKQFHYALTPSCFLETKSTGIH